MRANTRLVAIDLDGTLVDSAPDLSFCLGEGLKAVGLRPPSEAETRGWIGGGIEQLVRRALAAAGTGADDAYATALATFKGHYVDNLFVRSKLYAHVPETLETLQREGYRLCCITNKRVDYADKLLEMAGIRDCFEIVYGGDSFAEKKPHPRQLHETVAHTGIDARFCVMVGDSTTDMDAAAAAGFRFVWAAYGYCATLPERPHRAHATIREFAALPAALAHDTVED